MPFGDGPCPALHFRMLEIELIRNFFKMRARGAEMSPKKSSIC